jgi:hypothetical protein
VTVLCAILAGCGDSEVRPDATAADAIPIDAPGPRGIDLGVTWTPIGYVQASPSDLMAFYQGHAAYGTTIAVHRPWRATRASAGQVDGFATQIAGAATTYDFELMAGFGTGPAPQDLTSESEPTNDTWTNAESRAEFCAMAAAWAMAHKPRYLFLGNEMDGYYRDHPEDWPNWVTELAACRDAVHAVSPTTLVFTTFQLEFVKGRARKTGLPQRPPDWQLIADVEAAVDGIGFTSYPFFEYETPAEIPADYYTEIAQHTTKPVLFSELGWIANPAIPYTGSAAEQAAFVDRFFALIGGLDVRYAVYLHENDLPISVLPAASAFYQVGLRDEAGVARPADAAWRAHVTALRE